MIRKMAQFKVHADKVDEALEAIETFITAIRANEPGVDAYDSLQMKDGVHFVHLMEFDDEAAEDAHRVAEHTKEFVRTLYPLCEEEPVFTDIAWASDPIGKSHHHDHD